MPSLIHKDSAACAKSELDLFLNPPTHTAIEKDVFVILPFYDRGLLEFNISGSGYDYVDLSAS